eukprot:TRINITY_DN2781_c1_g4_i1.p1 TRINITY_DN2781_c1_g4~~TRINITY_DN2781_c1_g4_i1.p1  ORF type:complete len:296 (-),score=13.76 TRINITY_DN2781_c1_g4_i1:209-970(-)
MESIPKANGAEKLFLGSNVNDGGNHSEQDLKADIQKSPSKKSILDAQLVEGFALILKSNYLICVCIFILLNNFTASMFYFQKSLVARNVSSAGGGVTAWFATINANYAAIVLVLQLTATGRILSIFGVLFSLLLSPLCCMFGLIAIQSSPTPTIVMFSDVFRKISNYTVSKPAREILFTVIPQEEKYKAKVCIDTVVLRVGDSIAAATFQYLVSILSFSSSQVAGFGVFICAIWLMFSVYLGQFHNRMHRQVS